MPPSAQALARCIEHTLLRPDATRAEIAKLCREAIEHRFHGVCVNGSRVMEACQLIQETELKVITVVGFPLGAMDSDAKRFETECAIDNGAHEIDAVINVGWLKEGNHKAVLRELRDIVEAADERLVKIILETGLLTRDEKILAGHLVQESGAQFVKTSTGFGPANGTVEDVRLLRETVGPKFGIKASGGIRDLATARVMIEAGANRIGTSHGSGILADPELKIGY